MTLADVLSARERIAGRVRRTPTLRSAPLSRTTGADVYLKAELLQCTGSFKPRGVVNKVDSLTAAEKRRGVLAVSAGNLAAAVAYAAAFAEVDALLVMWQGASEQKVELVRQYGARVDLEASSPGEALDRVGRLQAETGRTFIRPWDDPAVMAGHGTLGLDLLDDVPDCSCVVCPVGGGGLASGLAVAVKSTRPETRFVAVEPELAQSLHESLAAGQPVSVEPRSVADGLNAPTVGDGCLAICRDLVDDLVLVSEVEIEEAFRFLYADAKLACEPAGAVATAAVLAGKVPLERGEQVVSVVSGGNVAPEIASAILEKR